MSKFPKVSFSRVRTAMAAGLLALATSSAVLAGPFEDAAAAYERGDYATAMRLSRPLADQGNPGAQNYLGDMYLSGHGVAQDAAEAARWFRKAADQGNAEAQNSLGDSYFHGFGVRVDHAQAARWYRQAADQGLAEAQTSLGALYENGFGVAQDYVQALMWSTLAASRYPAAATESRRLAAVQRDREAAKMSPAQIAQTRQLVNEWKPVRAQPASAGSFKDAAAAMQRNDYPTAARLLGPLAEQGLADAQTMLGSMYNTGQGVALDHTEAVKWFRSAARQGDAGGQDSLGLAYEEGTGVSRDYVRAYMWYGLAATSGDPFAGEFAKDRDAIASKMTKAQVAQALVLASKCKLSNFKDCE